MSTEGKTDAEQIAAAQEEIRAAAAKLQKLRDKQMGVTRVSRNAWDELTDEQRQMLSDSVVRGLVVIEDSTGEENYQWNN